MSNYIPLVLQIEILCRLPAKSLIRFRSVSKEWKSLIDSSEFNSDFIIGQPQRKRFLLTVSSDDDDDDEHEKGEYCWIVDDDSFPQNRISLTYPKSVDPLLYYDIKFVGSSHGLICFTSYYYYYSGEEGDSFDRYVIWNPCIRKSVSIDHAPIDAPYYNYKYKYVFVGFGVCPNSLDPKIVRINIFKVTCDNEHKHKIWQVEVYTLSAGVWRSLLTELPSEWFDISLTYAPPLVSNGFIYWCAYENNSRFFSMIVSFDLSTEKFTKILVPDKLTHRGFRLFKLRGSLGAVQIFDGMDSNEEFHEVWLTDNVSKVLTKIFTITLPKRWEVVGFRDNGQVLIKKVENHDDDDWCEYRSELVTYDPDLKQIKDLGLHVSCLSFTSSYTESLFLLNQSDALNDDDDDDDDSWCLDCIFGPVY